MGSDPAWLPGDVARWAHAHGEGLDAIYSFFDRFGEWPNPVELQRQLRAAGKRIPLARLANEMPAELGRRTYAPDEVVLSLFGIASCAGSKELLDNYFGALRLAVDRHDQPKRANRLGREDVVAALSLNEHEADRLSKVLLADCPFLAGGESDLRSWDREIDERVVEYDDVSSIDEFLIRVSRQRWPTRFTSAPPVAPPSSRDSPSSAAADTATPTSSAATDAARSEDEGPSPTSAALLVLGFGANALAIVLAPLPLAVGMAVATLAALIVFWRWPRLRLWLAASIIVLAGLAAGLGVVVVVGGDAGGRSQPSVAEQLEAVVARAAQERRYVAVRRRVPIHGTGTRSHLLVLRDLDLRDRFRTDLATPQALSDDIRIYDEVDGRLRLRFRFQPQNPGEVAQRPDGDLPGFLLRVGGVADYDKNGELEIVGALERNSLASGPFPVPVIIVWDEADGRYRIHALIPEPPDLRPPRDLPRVALEGYVKPTEIRNQHSDQVLRGHAVDEFTVVPAPGAPVLVAAYAEQTIRGYGGRHELKGWLLDLQPRTPRFLACGPTAAGRLIVRPESPVDLTDKMRQAAREPTGCGEP